MNLEERDDFLNRLTLDDKQLGFVVMGGVFTESIDIEQASLEGVIVVSPGIPPRSIERDRISDLSEHGYEIAYRRPAMTRVVQAAGRVVRGREGSWDCCTNRPTLYTKRLCTVFPFALATRTC